MQLRADYPIPAADQDFAKTLMGTVINIDPNGNFEVQSGFGTNLTFTMVFNKDFGEEYVVLPNGQHFDRQQLLAGDNAAHAGQDQEKQAQLKYENAHVKVPGGGGGGTGGTGGTGGGGNGGKGGGNNGGNTGGNGNNGGNTWDNQVTTYVIGQTMTRVRKYARRHGYKWYKPMDWRKAKDPTPKGGIVRDLDWLWGLTQRGVRIMDIGPNRGIAQSDFYNAETALLDAIDYWNWIIDPDPGV